MPHPLQFLIDQRLGEAAGKGEFDDLPGSGKPIPDLDVTRDPVLDRLMKEAGAHSPAVLLSKEIKTAEQELNNMTDPAERVAKQRALADLRLKIAIEIEAARKHR